MLDLFITSPPYKGSVWRAPAYEYVRGAYLRQLLDLQDYYANRVYAVRNQHFLVQLLTQIDTPLEYDDEHYVEVTRTRAPYLAKAFRMSSELSAGVVHDGVFYGRGNDEIILAVDEYFDIDEARRNWKQICAVRSLYHPRSDLRFMLANGKRSSDETGLYVISVNIALLALQWRAFLKEQAVRAAMQNVSVLGATHFVHMHVLPNMFFRYADLSVLERARRLLYGEEMTRVYFKHPIPVLNYEERVDALLNDVLGRYANTRTRYEVMLQALFGIGDVDASKYLMLPDIAMTRQVKWVLWVSRLPVMEFLADWGGSEALASNAHHWVNFTREVKKLLRDSIFREVLPKLLYDSVCARFERLLVFGGR